MDKFTVLMFKWEEMSRDHRYDLAHGRDILKRRAATRLGLILDKFDLVALDAISPGHVWEQLNDDNRTNGLRSLSCGDIIVNMRTKQVVQVVAVGFESLDPRIESMVLDNIIF